MDCKVRLQAMVLFIWNEFSFIVALGFGGSLGHQGRLGGADGEGSASSFNLLHVLKMFKGQAEVKWVEREA